MNIKISSTGGLLLGDATNGYKEIASKEYVDTKTFSIAWGDITGKPSTFAPAEHTHSDYVSKSATAAQALHSSISTTLSSGEIKIKSSATSAGEAGLYVDSSDAYVWVGVDSSQSWLQKDRIGYTADGNTQTELMFPARTSSDEVKTIATTDQLLQIGTTATTAAAGNHTHSGYAASSHNHAAGNITSGTLAIARGGTGADGSSITKNYVFAAPSASNGAVSFRALTVADLPTGNTASTVALGNHTHSDYVSKTATGNSQAIKTGLSIATDKSISLGGETGKGNIVLSSATNAANTYISVGSTDGEYIYIEKDKFGYTSDGEQTASILKFPPPSTDVKTIATTDHTHSDYVSKSETSSQSLSGSLSFPAMQQAYFGSQNSAYAWVWDAGFGVGVGSTDHTGIQHDKITHTVSSDTVNLTFPSSIKSGDIATEYDIRKRTRVLYESVIGDSSTPATAVTISEDYNIYHFWIGANGTFPTFTFSFPNFESIPARFPFTLIAHVNSGASTLTGPSGWAWTSGAGLPTSGFAGKVLWISGFKKTNDSTEVPLVSCWRCA